MHKRGTVRTRWATGLVALAVSAALAGCGSDTASSTSDGPLRVAVQAQPGSMDPIVDARSGQYVWGSIMDPLMSVDDDLAPSGDGLITEWERTDPTTWEFTVRDGVSFTNGEPLDADAVAQTLLTTRDADNSILKTFFGNIADAVAKDPQTLVVTTTTPQYNLVDLLPAVYAMPPKYYAEVGSEGFTKAPIGSGPYKLEEIRAGRDITVMRNDDYWGEAPAVERIAFSWSADPAQRSALLQTGAADVALGLPPAQAEQLAQEGFNITDTETTVKMTAFLQSDAKPLDDPEVREAVATAIDIEPVVDSIFDGKAVVDAGFLNVQPGQEPAETVTPDPDRARQLLGGRSIDLPLTYPTNRPNVDEVVQAIGGQLENVGFNVSYHPMEYPNFVGQMVEHNLTGVYIFAGIPNAVTPDYFASAFMKSQSITANCPDPQIDANIAKALEQPDAAAAQAVYEQLNTQAVVEKHCYVPLYREVYSIGTAEGVSGVQYSPANTLDLSDVTVD